MGMARLLAWPVISVGCCAGKTVVGCGNLVCGDAEIDCNEDPRCCKNGAFCLEGCTFGMDKDKKGVNWTDGFCKLTDCCQWSCTDKQWENLTDTCKSWCWLEGIYKEYCCEKEWKKLKKGCRWNHITDLLCCSCGSCAGCMRLYDSDILECLCLTLYYSVQCLAAVASG